MTPEIGRTLSGFHHKADLSIVRMKPRRETTDRWEYQNLEAAMAELGIEEVDTYILCLQNTIYHYITTHPILRLYMEAERSGGQERGWHGSDGKRGIMT